MALPLSDEQIFAYLEERPHLIASYLEKNPVQANPSGARLFDATGKIVAKARAEARRLSKTNQSLLDAAATNMLHWQALHHATLGFLACNDLISFAQMIDEELPVIFNLAQARLVMPEQTAIDHAEELGFVVLPAEQVQTILPSGSIYLGPVHIDGLFSTPAASMAAIALPDQLPAPVAGSALLLAGHNETSFTPKQGQTLLTNLAEIAGVCLMAKLEAVGLLTD